MAERLCNASIFHSYALTQSLSAAYIGAYNDSGDPSQSVNPARNKTRQC